MPKRPNQIALTLPPQLRTRIEGHAQRTGLAVSEIIRAACAEYIDRRRQEIEMSSNYRNLNDPYEGNHDYKRWQREMWQVFNSATGEVDTPVCPQDQWYMSGMSAAEAGKKLIELHETSRLENAL